MPSPYTPLARKIRQFHQLAAHINDMIKTGAFQRLSREQQNRITRKLRTLWLKCRAHLNRPAIIRTLGMAAIFVGLSTGTQAQHTPGFIAPVTNPFALSGVSQWPMSSIKDLDGDGGSGHTYRLGQWQPALLPE